MRPRPIDEGWAGDHPPHRATSRAFSTTGPERVSARLALRAPGPLLDSADVSMSRQESAMADVDRHSEDEWFLRHERHLLETARIAREERERERAARETTEERRALREAHWMKCPKCGHDMKAEDYSGIELDRCTCCEGLFFDAGELDEFARKMGAERRGIVRKILGF